MSRWFAKIDDEEFGPFRTETLRRWTHNGQLRPDSQVRKEHEETWQSLDDAMQTLRAAEEPPATDVAPPPPPWALRPNDVPPRLPRRKMLLDAWPSGTEGKMPLTRIFIEAFTSLVANARLMILAGALLWLLGGLPSHLQKLLGALDVNLHAGYGPVLLWLSRGWLLTVGAMLTLGGITLSLRVVTDQSARLADLFRPFRAIGELLALAAASAAIAMTAMALVLCGLAGWFVHPLWGVLVLPGVYVFVRYSQVPYLATWRTDLGVGQTLKRSGAIIKGHRLKFLLLTALLVVPWLAVMVLLWWAKGGGRWWHAFQGWEAYLVNICFALVYKPLGLLAGAIFHRDLNPPQPDGPKPQELSGQ
jgi:hypothetical protein